MKCVLVPSTSKLTVAQHKPGASAVALLIIGVVVFTSLRPDFPSLDCLETRTLVGANGRLLVAAQSVS